jgi:hypothetical protein
MKGMIHMSKKRHLIIAGLASMTLFAGFTTYADYYDHVKKTNIAGFSNKTASPQISAEAPQNTLLFSKASLEKVTEILPLQEQPQAVANADPAPERPAPQPVQPATIPLPNVSPAQAAPLPVDAPSAPPNNSPQVTQPAQDPITPAPAPAPAKQKTTTTRAS